jgi:hypothetical protein
MIFYYTIKENPFPAKRRPGGNGAFFTSAHGDFAAVHIDSERFFLYNKAK